MGGAACFYFCYQTNWQHFVIQLNDRLVQEETAHIEAIMGWR